MTHVPDEAGNLHLLDFRTEQDGRGGSDWRINPSGAHLPAADGLWTPDRRSVSDFLTTYGQHGDPGEERRRHNTDLMRDKALLTRGPGNVHVKVSDNMNPGSGMSFLVDPSGRYAGEPDWERGR